MCVGESDCAVRMAPEYGTIGAAERSYPEERPLIGAAAYARDTLTLLNERRRTILFVLAAALLFLGIVIAAQVHGDAIADSMNGRVMQGCDHAPDCGEALCASQYSNYTMIAALNGRLSQAAAQSYLTSFPTSLATRYMADTAMYRWRLNTTAAVSFDVLSRLVQSEPLPERTATNWCVVHLAMEDHEHGTAHIAHEASKTLAARLATQGITPKACGDRIHLVSAAQIPECTSAAAHATLAACEAYIHSVHAEVCSLGFATTMRIGLDGPDATLALLSRSKASLSSDAELEQLAVGVRMSLLHGSRSTSSAVQRAYSGRASPA